MKPTTQQTLTAFLGQKRIANGGVLSVALKVKKQLQKSSGAPLLIFDDLTSAQIEIDFRGSSEAVLKRLKGSTLASATEKKTGPGRPKLGVVSREISLLPRHWHWLALQPGGASVTLRKLVEDAKKKNVGRDLIRQSQDATYKFMTVMAGNLPQFEEALRALYAKNMDLFEALISKWPKDVVAHIEKLSSAAFEKLSP